MRAPGRFVNVGDTLFRVTETAPLLARVRVPEAIGRRASTSGTHATVVERRRARRPARVVASAAPVIDAASGTREVVASRARSQQRAHSPARRVTVRLGAQRRHVVAIAARRGRRPTDMPSSSKAPEAAPRFGRSRVGADLGDGRVEIVNGLSLGRADRPARQADRRGVPVDAGAQAFSRDCVPTSRSSSRSVRGREELRREGSRRRGSISASAPSRSR